MKHALYASYQGKAQYIIVYYNDGTKATYSMDDPEAVESLWHDISSVFPEDHDCIINAGLRDYDDSDWFTIALSAN
jgi:hypothetical protein